MNREQHWDQVYQTKAPEDVSWFKTRPATSLRLIESSGVPKGGGIIAELGAEFQLLEQANETHVTPWNTEQRFTYFRFAPGGWSTSRLE